VKTTLNEVASLKNIYKYIIKGLTLRFYHGSYAIVGPNGSGKTTILKLLAGIIAPERGEVRVYGSDPYRDHRVRAIINYVASQPLAEGIETVSDYLDLYYMTIPKSLRRMRPYEALKALKVEGLYNSKFHELSEGQRKRVELSKLLIRRSSVILVDEPTAFLDAEGRSIIRDLLSSLATSEEKLLVIVTHDYEILRSLKPSVVSIEDGRVIKIGDYETLIEFSGLRH
jgi:ABC-type multidrug transport system ATPase subunit